MQNKFLSRFDLVKSKFKKNLKDNIFEQEIEKFTKYNIIDENNMFNYIYIHNYYENLIEKPFEYKVNIISKSNEQLLSFFQNYSMNLILNMILAKNLSLRHIYILMIKIKKNYMTYI